MAFKINDSNFVAGNNSNAVTIQGVTVEDVWEME